MYNANYLLASQQGRLIQDVRLLADNVANSNTAGHKEIFMRAMQRETQDVNDKLSFAKNKDAFQNPSNGGVIHTGSKLDVAVVGPAYMMVSTPWGNRYTKNGRFAIDNTGKLVNHEGFSVLSADGQEIVFDETDTDITITPDGFVLSGAQQRGSIGMFEFTNPSLVKSIGNSLNTSDEEPAIAEKSQLMQGAYEGSNVNPIAAMTHLSEIQANNDLVTELLKKNYNIQSAAFKTYARIGG